MNKKSQTTDPQDELFDVVDEQDVVLGSMTRCEAHNGEHRIHRSVNILVFNRKGALFFQKRSATKDTDPSKWTISCSGHVGKGGAYEESAHRELVEELGVDMEIVEVYTFICKAPNETEMMTVFKGICEGPFRLNTTEITEGTFITQKDLHRLIKKGKIELSFMAKMILEKYRWLA